MFRNLRRVLSFISHYLSAGNEHDVHSPFVFKLLTEAIYAKKRSPFFGIIETIRKDLLSDTRILKVTDFGAGSSYDGVVHQRSVGEIAYKFAKPPRYGRLLHRVVHHLQPVVMVELGTSLGISAMYQAAGNPNGILYTLEGCNETAHEAKANFQKAGISNIRCLTGNFDDTFPHLLKELGKVDYVFIDGNHTCEATLKYFNLVKSHSHEKTTVVFDDINWSEDMKRAWHDIKADPIVTITLDFYFLGIVFFDPRFSKENFKLRLKWNR